MPAQKKFAGLFRFPVVAGCAPFMLIALSVLVVTGCGGGKHKSRHPKITTTALPEGEVSVAYPTTQLTATGGTTPYTWSDVNNILQSYGLSLDPTTGEITGTPTQVTPAGGVTVTFEVTDADNKTAQKDLTLVIYPELQISTTSLPAGYDGQTGYSATLSATGGTGTYIWSITNANLPQNLNLDPSTGEISGDIASNASTNSPYNFTVEVTDGLASKQANLSITVYSQLQITTTSLDEAIEGVSYSFTLTASGGDATNYNWSVTGQPSWLSIDAATGEMSGTPPTGSAGTYTFTVTVDDGLQTVSKQFDLVVKPSPPTADFEASPAYGTAPLNVAFTDKSTGTITQWEWDFDNDGNVDSTDRNPQWTYSNPGVYTVRLKVTGPGGSDACIRVDYICVRPSGGALKANFAASPRFIELGQTVQFYDLSSGNPTSWEWDFDNDGSVDSTVQNPMHTYNDPGWYTVKLTVSDGTDSDTCVKEMYVLVANSIYYVDGVSGDDANGGTGWGDAWKTIGHALSQVGDYDLVLVADATYDETNLSFNGKKIYLKGVDHNTAGQRPVIDCQGSGRAFFFYSGETNDSVIDNFLVRGGNDNEGGAIYCITNSSPTITNCTFSGNSAGWYGGAIYCKSSSPGITNCVFNGNSASNEGGAIYCITNSSPTVENCTFSGNSASQGCAICCYESSPTITNCTFCGSSSVGYRGGAIWCKSSSPTITNCTFSDNSAQDYGGAIFCESSDLTVINCIFKLNDAFHGGAIACFGSAASIINCIFVSNGANDRGGAVYCARSDPTITNCTFSSNSADCGGAIFCYDYGSPTLNNCILWGNSARNKGNEIYIRDSSSSCTLNSCCVDSTGYAGVTSNIVENNCINADPQFVDPANGDYHLQDTSPCIDAGDDSLVPGGVTTDLDGNPRIANGTVDIGAYEYQP